MKYTFEITVAGCATTCAHCYVGGGRAPCMRREDFTLCLDKLGRILDSLQGEIHVTLGNEIFCHPQIADLLRLTCDRIPQYFSYCDYEVPTTGIALLHHRERERIVSLLRDTGVTQFMLALHGGEADHNRLVQNPKAYRELLRTAEYLADSGFSVLFNLMVSRTLHDGFDAVMREIEEIPRARPRLTVPLYLPTDRMRAYENNRADVGTCLALAERAERWGIPSDALRQCAKAASRHTVLRELTENGFDFERAWQQMPDWAFFHVNQDLDLYYGNVGMHTEYLGNLRQGSVESWIERIRPYGANYDYTAFYGADVFRSLPDLTPLTKIPAEDLVYASRADCLYRLLDDLGISPCLIG